MDNNELMQQMQQINLQNQMIQNSILQQRRTVELDEEMRMMKQANAKKKKRRKR